MKPFLIKPNLVNILLLAFFILALSASTMALAQEETMAAEEVSTETNNDSSIVGGFFNFLGDVIAFPFRMVASAFDAIF